MWKNSARAQQGESVELTIGPSGTSGSVSWEVHISEVVDGGKEPV